MHQEKVWMIAGLLKEKVWMIAGLLIGVFVLGALYGYWIGTVARRSHWSAKRVKRTTLLPFAGCMLVLTIASVVSREASGYGASAAAWAKFPWVIMLSAGFLAMFIAVRVAFPGVPWRELDTLDKLSIR
jgi:zinc transporter ZupT